MLLDVFCLGTVLHRVAIDNNNILAFADTTVLVLVGLVMIHTYLLTTA